MKVFLREDGMVVEDILIVVLRVDEMKTISGRLRVRKWRFRGGKTVTVLL